MKTMLMQNLEGIGGGGRGWGHIRCIMRNVEVAYTGLLGFAPVGSTFVIKVCSVPTHSGSSKLESRKKVT